MSPEIITLKTCSGCRRPKLLSCFNWRKDKGCYRGKCTICMQRAAHRLYRSKRKVYIERNRVWRAKNRQRWNAYFRAYKRSHPDKTRGYALKWAQLNPDRLLTDNSTFLSLEEVNLS